MAGGAMTVQADITIATRVVANRGNLADTSTGFGAVAYSYRIGTYEVTNTQYAAFLTAKAAVTDTSNLYNASMAGQCGGITQTAITGGYTYAVKAGFANKPVNYVSFWDATRFTNWLNNGQGSGSTETGGYTLTEAAILSNTVTRNVGADWVVPTENEWYKAAYYDPNKGGLGVGGYWQRATKSDTLGDNTAYAAANGANYHDSNYANGGLSGPGGTNVGSYSKAFSNYGTFDQGGNVSEWNEQDIGGGSRMVRGGSWADGEDTLRSSLWSGGLAPAENFGIGFRVASLTPKAPANPAMLNLGWAQRFAVLTGIAITADGRNEISGTGGRLVGISNGSAFAGATAVIGVKDEEKLYYTPLAVNAIADATAAWKAGEKASFDGDLSGDTTITLGELGSLVPYTPGIYAAGVPAPLVIGQPSYLVRGLGAYTMVTDITLDGQNNPDSVFIFHTYAAFTTTANTTVHLINGAHAENIFWIVGAAFTAGAYSTFSGTVIAKAGVTLGAASTLYGQVFGLISSSITLAYAAEIINNSPIPEPSTYGVAMGATVLGVVVMRRRRPGGSR